MKRRRAAKPLRMDPRQKLEAIFNAGVAACHPARVVPPHLPEPPAGHSFLLALGKAAVPMARAAEQVWSGPLTGLAVAPEGSGGTLDRIEIMTAAHPVPDQTSVAAAKQLLGLATNAGADDLVLLLLSGGASSLACLPSAGLTLAEKRRIVGGLLRAGAPIGEINCVRRHLSSFKGGRIGLAASPARLVTLAISDVVGDKPEDIGSGPTVHDPSRIEDARAILRRYGISPLLVGWSESAKAVTGEWCMIASSSDALAAAAAQAGSFGYQAVLSEAQGDARTIGRAHAELAARSPPGTALISGGELTVAVTGDGRGGPNQEYALAAAIGLAGRQGISGLAADSDGIDGNSGAAGAFFDGQTVERARRDPDAALADNDSEGFFASLGDLFVTGPTATNVNDLRILLIDT